MTDVGINREKMQNTIVRTLGFEHLLTIWFFELCEQYDDNPQNNKKLLEIVAILIILGQDVVNELE